MSDDADGTATYRETPEELAEQVLTAMAVRMEQLLNEIMLVCPPHRVKYWEREQQELGRLTREWLLARTDASLEREEPARE